MKKEVKQKMDYKKFAIAALLLMVMASANAAITLTAVEPTGNIYTPNMGTDYIDVRFTVVDDNGSVPIHKATIQFAKADGNVLIANDTNLSTSNCAFTTANLWTTPGATCTIRYILPTGNNQLPTRGYVIDYNVTGYTAAATVSWHFVEATTINTFSIDNRYVSNSVEGLLNILPIVLIAALVVSIVLAMAGILEPKTVIYIAIGGVISIIAVIIMAAILGVLTP